MTRDRVVRAFVSTVGLHVLSFLPVGSAAEFRVVPGGIGDMSDDGRVIVGSMFSAAAGSTQAYKWSIDTGFEWIPMAAPQEEYWWMGCIGEAASGDGSKLFIACQIDMHHIFALHVNDIAPFVYENGVLTPWERDNDESYIYDVTPDGTRAVGYSFEYESITCDHTNRAVWWHNRSVGQSDEMDGGNCEYGAADDHKATAMSDDATVAVGWSGDWFSDGYNRPIAWVYGVPSRLDISTPECGEYVAYQTTGTPGRRLQLSGDGRYAVGGPYWPIDTRFPVYLPGLIPGEYGDAKCMDYDGSMVGGSSGDRAVLWDRSAGSQVQDVYNLLASKGLQAAIAGWKLTTVVDMSADGKRIAGYGTNPNGQNASWWADLRDPPPINDLCVNAPAIQPNHTATYVYTSAFRTGGTTRAATHDGTTTCGLTNTADAWFKYTAPLAGFLQLDLCATTSLPDGYISVHTGCPGTSLNEIACGNQCPQGIGCGLPCLAVPAVQLEAGMTYYISVGGAEGHDFYLNHRFLPLNDDCGEALSVGHSPSSTPGTTDWMTLDAAPTCQGVTVTAAGVWYKVIGTGTTMTATTCARADYDTKLNVYCGGCGGMTCVGANDDGGCGVGSSVSWCSEAGAIYHILVSGYQSYSGDFQLDVSDNGQSCVFAINCHPANDDCPQAESTDAGTLMSDNTGANTSTSVSCAPSSNDVWFQYHTRCDGVLWADTCQLGLGDMADSVVSIHDACDGTTILCNDDYSDATVNCGHRSAAFMPVMQEQDLVIRVAGYGLDQLNQGTFPLRISEVPDPLAVQGGPMPDGYLGTSYMYGIPYRGSCGRRILAVSGLPRGFVMDSVGVIFGVPISAGDFAIHVDVCNNDILNPECASGDFTLRIWPTNDDCDDALAVSEGLHFFGNTGATTDGPNEPMVCDSEGDSQVASDVWYVYTSQCQGQATVDLCSSNFDTKVAVYQGSRCRTLDGALACNDDSCGLQSRLSWPVDIGSEYLVRVGGFLGAQGNGEMLITCINDCNANQQSDAEEIAGGLQSDCNYNARPDDCDARGDYSADNWFGLQDLSVCLNCMVGPNLPTSSCCLWIDFDSDFDVDLHDMAALQRDLRAEPFAR